MNADLLICYVDFRVASLKYKFGAERNEGVFAPATTKHPAIGLVHAFLNTFIWKIPCDYLKYIYICTSYAIPSHRTLVFYYTNAVSEITQFNHIADLKQFLLSNPER